MIDQNPTQEARQNPQGGLSQLVSGKWINLFELTPADIDVEHIAGALSKLCRYNGHVAGFISVGRHSIRCAEQAIRMGRQDVALECLLHDSAEAYIGDLVRPMKNHPHFKEAYLSLEANIEIIISDALKFNYPFDPFVKEMDIFDSKLEMGTNNDGERFDPGRWDDIDVTRYEFKKLYRKLYFERFGEHYDAE